MYGLRYRELVTRHPSERIDVACMREVRNAHENVIGKPEKKRPLGRPRHRWEDCLKRVLKKQSTTL
jgi:hypothetical protein